MKLDFNQTNVHEMVGIGQARVSQMKASPLAFDILSKRIYKNKVKAPIQELSCNAKDAHVMVGKPELPIEVKLPNALDPEFYVKDWGPGLTEEDVMNLYMTYFMSTKSESDAFTGAFGLGSKSPFSYVDQFWVTSAQNGIQTTYLAFKDNKGMPSISKVEGSTVPAPSDWQSGLRVGFPAAAQDFSRFAEEAATVFSWFDVKPVVKGEYKTVKRKIVYQDDDFYIFALAGRPVNHFGHQEAQPSYVRMGSVGYEIEPESLKGLISESELSFLTAGHVFKVGIGEVSVTASRESLEYDERTLTTLRKKLLAATSTVVQRLADAIGVNPAVRSLNAIRKAIGPFAPSLAMGTLQVEWGTAVVAAVFAQLNSGSEGFDLSASAVSDLLRTSAMSFPGWMGGTGDVGVSVFRQSQSRLTQKSVWAGKTSNNEAAMLHLSSGPVVVVIDDVSYAANRCKAALEAKTYGEIVFVSGKKASNKDEIAHKIADHFFNVPVVLASNLPKGKETVRLSYTRDSKATPIQRSADRLKHYENEEVLLFTADEADVGKHVPLKDALAQTSAYLIGNFTCNMVRNQALNSIQYLQLRLMLRANGMLHPALKEAQLDSVIVLSTTMAQKLRAIEHLSLWDVEVARVIKENRKEISKTLKTLPGFMPGVRRGTLIHDLKSSAGALNPLVLHMKEWVNNSGTSAEGGKVTDAFMSALAPDLRKHVEYLVSSLGMVLNRKTSHWDISDSEKAWHGLAEMTMFLEKDPLWAELARSVAWTQDKAYFENLKTLSTFFQVLDLRSNFIQYMKGNPQGAADVYNAMWNLGNRGEVALLKAA